MLGHRSICSRGHRLTAKVSVPSPSPALSSVKKRSQSLWISPVVNGVSAVKRLRSSFGSLLDGMPPTAVSDWCVRQLVTSRECVSFSANEHTARPVQVSTLCSRSWRRSSQLPTYTPSGHRRSERCHSAGLATPQSAMSLRT